MCTQIICVCMSVYMHMQDLSWAVFCAIWHILNGPVPYFKIQCIDLAHKQGSDTISYSTVRHAII